MPYYILLLYLDPLGNLSLGRALEPLGGTVPVRPPSELSRSKARESGQSNHINHFSQGKGSQGSPIRDYSGLLGLVKAYWVALAPHALALMAYMIQGIAYRPPRFPEKGSL